ncbi:MAG TPA: YpdA family putative bacillithiol disulfide reductase [Gemmatimonadales bacterium]|nr:YpdA family putative bacillithiol disulfide reductase [Gemmatimonadales bacterium]
MTESVLVVGAGPIGLACAISARRRGIDPLIVDAGAIAESIARYPVGMIFFTTPERLEIGGHPLVCAGAKPTREEALMYYRGVARAERLRVRTYTRLTGAERVGTRIACRLQRTLRDQGGETVECDRLVLATGYFDHPNRLHVSGEDLPHVSHYSEEAHRLAGLDVVIVGAKNSGVELALNAFRAGARVTVVHRGASFKPTVKYWLRPDFENRVKAGEIAVRWNTAVREIRPGDVVVEDAGGVTCLPADRVFLLTGFHPDFALLRALGIAVDEETGRPAHDPETLETNVPGIYLAGSLTAGKHTSEIFIENGRFDGERIFGDAADRRRPEVAAARAPRPVGE